MNFSEQEAGIKNDRQKMRFKAKLERRGGRDGLSYNNRELRTQVQSTFMQTKNRSGGVSRTAVDIGLLHPRVARSFAIGGKVPLDVVEGIFDLVGFVVEAVGEVNVGLAFF